MQLNCRCLALSVALSCGASLVCVGQKVAPPDVTLRTTTRVIAIDVIVTDGKSQPVANLKASDFTILEDGKPQKVSFFSYESALQPKQASAPPKLAPFVFTNRPEYHMPAAGTPVVLLMDGLNTPLNQGQYVRQQIVKYLAGLKGPNSGTAILALGNTISVLQDFTTDRDLLLAAAQQYKQGRTAADVEGLKVPLDGTGMSAELGSRFEKMVTAEEQDVRIRGTLAAFRTISRSLLGYPGRKALLWFSASFPLRLDLNSSDDFSIYKSYREEVQQTSALLSDANVAVYPIDARGLSAANAAIPNSGTPTGFDPDHVVGAPPTDTSVDEFKRFNTEATMDSIAYDTGGLVIRNTNDLNAALQTAIKDSQTYYSLAYYPQKKAWDGKFHSIKIVVANKDLKVRARSGYYALDPASWKKGSGEDSKRLITTDPRVLAATGILFYSHLVPPQKKGGPTAVEILADASTITFAEGPEFTYQPDVDFEVGAFTPDGKLLEVESEHAQGDLQRDTYAEILKHGMGTHINLNLKPGQYMIRAAVRDNRNGHLGTLDMPLKVDQ